MMDGKGISGGSYLVLSEEKNETLYPMVFGVSCAFLALRLLSEPKISEEKWSDIRSGMLLGSAHLLGLLIWRVQKEEVDTDKSELLLKLENAKKEVEKLKKMRSEDAKANEKVVGIFASQEQCWFTERRMLRQQIGALMNNLRVLESKKDKDISELNQKLQENELLLMSKDKLMGEEEQKRHDLEEKLNNAHSTVGELKESAKHEAQRHSAEISKHKTAFIELVSNQRQLEAEMGRALRQVESAKQELSSVLEQKEQSVLMAQKLSLEIVKMRKDLEQKDQILSAMLRKSKLDTAEKQMLLEEMKLSKTKRKQAELETERLKAIPESKQERHSLRSMWSKQANSKAAGLSSGKGVNSNAKWASKVDRLGTNQINFVLEYEPEFSPLANQYPLQGNQDPTNFKQLEGLVRAQAEKYRSVIDEKHQVEIEAFTEQLRLKDEKLESFRWRLLSMELESKRSQSHGESLGYDLRQRKQDNLKLEALLLDREAELHSLRDKLALQGYHPSSQKTSSNPYLHDPTLAPDTIWSKVKIIKEIPFEEDQEIKKIIEGSHQKLENDKQDKNLVNGQHKDIALTLQSPEREFEEEEQDALPDPMTEECTASQDVDQAETSSVVVKYLTKKNDSTWKMDVHALGVSYKIKRLKQQLFMLEKLAGKQESDVKSESENKDELGVKGFYALMSLLNKQVDRYQSLQGKTDDLCQRMHENNLDLKGTESSKAKSKEETRLLEHFLEETFQLQRYIVATGQKLMELRSKIAFGFLSVANELDTPATFDMKKFADGITTLYGEVQRGLVIRIARIIGDLEGTLACDGIIHFKK